MNEETESLVNELAASGSTKTVDEVQTELDEISTQMFVPSTRERNTFSSQYSQKLDRDRTNVMKERDHQTRLQHTIDKEVSDFQLKELRLQAKIKEREDLQTRIESMKKDIVIFTQRAKARR